MFHKWHVLKAGLMIGGIPLWRLIIHDWSKFSLVEFVNYSHYKYGVKFKLDWGEAWLHHLHRNPHHPEYWLLSWRGDPNFYKELYKDVAPFLVATPMPKVYVREMVADFMATSKEKTGSYDISRWLNQNGPKMCLHYDTQARLGQVMIELGYTSIDNYIWSYMADVKTSKKLSL